MPKTFLLLNIFLVAINLNSLAQDMEGLIGRWKVVNVKGLASFYDVGKDSVSVLYYGEMGDKTPQSRKDSLNYNVKRLLKERFGNLYFIFKKDGKFEKQSGDSTVSSGLYTVDEKIKTIKLGSDLASPTLKYRLTKDLWLFELDGFYEFELKRL